MNDLILGCGETDAIFLAAALSSKPFVVSVSLKLGFLPDVVTNIKLKLCTV